MILIDTSAWIEFFRKSGSKYIKQKVAAYLDRDEAVYTCPVYYELIVGARDQEIGIIEVALSLCERRIFKSDYWGKAANLDRKLKQKGVTIPRDDLFVATVAFDLKMSILCKDRHFDIIRDKGGLKLKIEQLA